MFIDVVFVIPLASVTVYEWTPALTVNVPVPVYGAVPPVAVTVTVVVPPLQAIDPEATLAERTEDGWEILILVDFVQPFTSLTIIIWVPAGTLLKIFDDWYEPVFNL